MTAQKKRATTDGVHEHFVEAWLERWREDDLRRTVYQTLGVIVRQPCVARILIEAGQLDRRTGWRSTTAFALMSSLMRDMPHESAAVVLRQWNDGLAEPIEDSKLEGIIRHANENSDAPRPECDYADLGTWCVDKDDCDWYRSNRMPSGNRPRGAAAILQHGKPAALKVQELAVYEALCVLEETTSSPAGAPVPTASRVVAELVGVDKNAVKPALLALERLGYVEVVELGDAEKRHAASAKRIFPLPFHINTASASTPDGVRVRVDARTGVSARSDILGFFLDAYSEPVSGDVLSYLEKRGITKETADGVGLRQLTKAGLRRANDTFPSKISREELREAGLTPTFFRGFYYHPLLIPYREGGRVMTIKGRSLHAEDVGKTARYFNAPGSMPDAYRTSPVTHGQDVVVCEGEMDALSAFQLGFVALGLSTAVGFSEQLALRLRGCRVVLALDADEAGRAGAVSAEGKLSAAGIPFARLDLPHDDLNTLLREDAEALRALLKHAFESIGTPDGTGGSDHEPTSRARDPRFKGIYDSAVVGSPVSPFRDMTPAERSALGVGDAPTSEVDDAKAKFERFAEDLRRFT